MDKGSNFTATDACAAGYTRLGLWCKDTDGALSTLRFTAVHLSSYTVSNLNTFLSVAAGTVKGVLLRTHVMVFDHQGVSVVTGCVTPGDSSVVTRDIDTASARAITETNEVLSRQTIYAQSEVTMRANAAGEVRTRCDFKRLGGSGAPVQGECTWLIAGYLD